MSDETSPKPTRKQTFQCIGWGLLIIVSLPILLVLGLPATIAAWLKERRDGFANPSPEESARLYARVAGKKAGDVISIDGVPRTIEWVSIDKDDPSERTEFFFTDKHHLYASTQSFSFTREYPRWWFIKQSLRLNFKDIE